MVPVGDIPPFVPGGTGLRVVISRGWEGDKMPISEARVSPRQQEKCLEIINYFSNVVSDIAKH